MVDRTMPALLRRLGDRVTSLERRIARTPRAVDLSRITDLGRGSSVERDAYFGAPATDVERVALANRRVVWFNTDFGWEESYYADSALAGLTTLGLVAGTPSGWYPTGEGPVSVMYASGPQSVVASTYVTSWTAWGAGRSYRRGGATWFTYDTGRVTCLNAGRYEAEAMVTQQAGSGTTVTHLLRNANSIFARANPLDPGQNQAAVMHQPLVDILPGENFSVFSGVGSYQLNVVAGNTEVRGFFFVRYKAPLLVSE